MLTPSTPTSSTGTFTTEGTRPPSLHLDPLSTEVVVLEPLRLPLPQPDLHLPRSSFLRDLLLPPHLSSPLPLLPLQNPAAPPRHHPTPSLPLPRSLMSSRPSPPLPPPLLLQDLAVLLRSLRKSRFDSFTCTLLMHSASNPATPSTPAAGSGGKDEDAQKCGREMVSQHSTRFLRPDVVATLP